MIDFKIPYKKVLITGGAGFIGWRVAELLKRLGKEVCIVDNLYVGMPMPKEEKLVNTFKVDISHINKTMKVFKAFKPDAVIHLAAIHHIPTCEKKGPLTMRVNIVGTQIILDASEKYDVQSIVIASSGAVYDWVDDELTEEVTNLRPCDNYSVTKLANEQQLKVWCTKTNRMGRVARIFNTIGNDDPNGHLIPDIVQQLRNNTRKKTITLGNVKPKRDYIHANDTAKGIVSILSDSRHDITWDAFNICSGTEYSVEEIVKYICQIKNVDVGITSNSKKARKIDRPHQLGNPSKAKEILGWSAKKNIYDALRATLTPRATLTQEM